MKNIVVLLLLLYGLCQVYIGAQSGSIVGDIGFTFSIWSLYAYLAFVLMPAAGFGLVLSAFHYYKYQDFSKIKWVWLISLGISIVYSPVVTSTVFSVIVCDGYC